MNLDQHQIVLALLWVALMLIFLLGDVLRIFAGEFTPGEMDGQPVSQSMWFLTAIIMVIPIVMIVLSLFLPHQVNRWTSIVVSVLFFLLNLAGIMGYKPFDQFLLSVSFVLNGVIVWYAWSWQ